MRILLTTDTVGGVWTFTRELTQQLLEDSHDVALVSFGRMPSTAQLGWVESVTERYGDSFLFRANDAPLEWMQDNVYALDGAAVLRDVACAFRPDILHSNQFCWGAIECGVPTIITAHSDVLSWAAACKPELLQESSAWMDCYCSLVQRGLEGADCVAAPTQWMLRALKERFRTPLRSLVVSNGRTAAVPAIAAERKLQAISVGRLWDEGKGLRSLLEIDAPLPVLIAGEQSFENTSEVGSDLQALGPLTDSELFQLFSESSIYLAMSIYEPFGLAPLEAALCGCAIVARNLPSLREVWSDAANFFETSSQLTEILRNLVKDREQLRSWQAKAEHRAEIFTAARMACEYIALYRSLADPEHATSSSPQEFVTHAA